MASPPISSLIRVECCPEFPVGGEVLSRVQVSATRWLGLYSVKYKLHKDGERSSIERPRTWDMVRRSTKSGDADAVVVVALLSLGVQGDPRVLLVKQFRPPAACVTVEFPAGLIDEAESPEAAALRELREETGFEGRVLAVHNSQPLSPGLSDESVVIVHIEVTAQLSQRLEGSECIEVISVPVRRLREALDYLEETEKCSIMHSVGSLAAGIELFSRL